MNEKINLNQMFTALTINILTLSKSSKEESKISVKRYDINFFNPEKVEHRVFLQAAKCAQTIANAPIYIHMPLLKYLIWKNKNEKKNKVIKWGGNNRKNPYDLNISKEILHISKAFNADNKVWEEIAREIGV